MPADTPNTPNVAAEPLVDGFNAALDRLTAALDDGESRDMAVLRFMRAPAVVKAVRLAFDKQVRTAKRGMPGVSANQARQAIAAVLHTVIADKRKPLPTTVDDLIGLAQTISTNMVREAARVARLADTARINKARDAEWEALLILAGCPSKHDCPARQEGAQVATFQAFHGVLDAVLSRLAANYEKDCPAEPGSYLYLTDLETWLAGLMSDCMSRAVNDARYARGHYQLDELRDTRDEEDEAEEDGGIGCVDPDAPPGGSGGGAAAVPTSRREEDRERDLRRIASLRELVETAERVLSAKQRRALLAKLFSPHKLFSRDQREERAALLSICREIVRDVPREAWSDDELAVLIGSPNASAAQRNYNYGRANLLGYARSAEQRQEWQVILDALLPRRSRGSNPNDGAQT